MKREKNISFSWWIMMCRIFYNFPLGLEVFSSFLRWSMYLHQSKWTFKATPGRKKLLLFTKINFYALVFFCTINWSEILESHSRRQKVLFRLWIESDCNQLSKQMEKISFGLMGQPLSSCWPYRHCTFPSTKRNAAKEECKLSNAQRGGSVK